MDTTAALRPACADDPELFFSEDDIDIALAKMTCAQCPLLVECATAAADLEYDCYGVWAGCDTTSTAGMKDLHELIGRDVPVKTYKTCMDCLEPIKPTKRNPVCPQCRGRRVDITPTQTHIKRLKIEAGWTNREIGDRAQLTKEHVYSLQQPRRRRVSERIERRILSIDIPWSAA